ncbi:MAG: hypothetical protein HYS38_05495 [Acidobacteria bacterium]|nr:hypothetical protein [Acidobacteriota bacterium]
MFYRNGNKMIVVDTTTQPTFSAGKPRVLFEGVFETHGGGSGSAPVANYDVTPDGQRFLMVQRIEQVQAPTQINVVLNWFEELKKKVPVK